MRKNINLKSEVILELFNKLKAREFSILLAMLPYVNEKTCAINNNGETIKIEQIALYLGVDYTSMRRIVSVLKKNKLIIKSGDTNYLNPYALLNPNNVSDDVLELFYETEYAKHYDSGEITRCSPKYREWMKKILIRDNYKCQCCGSKLNPEVHHILSYAQFKDLRTDVDNGIVLCQSCHSPMVIGSFHQTYGTRNNTREQLEEYIINK